VIDAISFFFKKKYINNILKFAKLINFTVFLLLGWWAVISYDGVISLKKKKKKKAFFFFLKKEKKKNKKKKKFPMDVS
jgi:cytosine/uracil/thiamine/allantoin permease